MNFFSKKSNKIIFMKNEEHKIAIKKGIEKKRQKRN